MEPLSYTLRPRNRSKGLACLGFALAAYSVQAQDLFNDLVRQYVPTYTSESFQGAYFAPASYPNGSTWYRTGFVETPTQPIINSVPGPLVVSTQPFAYDYDVMSSLLNGKSGIYWNFHPTTASVPGGLKLPAESVTLSSADLIPTFEIDMPKDTTASFSVVTKVRPLTGNSTPGTFVLQKLVGGTWTTLFSRSVSGEVSDSRNLTATNLTRLRWLLVRSGSAPADAVVTVVITK